MLHWNERRPWDLPLPQKQVPWQPGASERQPQWGLRTGSREDSCPCPPLCRRTSSCISSHPASSLSGAPWKVWTQFLMPTLLSTAPIIDTFVAGRLAILFLIFAVLFLIAPLPPSKVVIPPATTFNPCTPLCPSCSLVCSSLICPGWLLHCILLCCFILSACASACCLVAASCCPPFVVQI